MQRAVPVGEGAMAALLGLDAEAARAVAAEATRAGIDHDEICAVANDNAPGQVVRQRPSRRVERAIAIAREHGARRSIMLPVSAPFHSPLLIPAAEAMAEALASVALRPPLAPLVANVTARPVNDPAEIKRLLVEQVTAMVRWRESVLFLAEAGVEEVVEIGAGRVLTGLVKRIAPALATRSVGAPAEVEALIGDALTRRRFAAGSGQRSRGGEMFDLSGQTALVTGASGGIGGAIARALHAQGAALMLSGTRAAALAALAGELGERAHVGDCRPRRAARPPIVWSNRPRRRWGISTSSSTMPASPATGWSLRMKDEDWQAVLDVDLTAAFRLTRAALRGMVRRRHGRIIGVTSVVALTGNPGQANYAAAKAAMIGMSKSIAAEVASRGITVNCVAPGFDRDGDDRKAVGGTARPARRGDSRRALRRPGRRRRRDRLSGERGGRLCHRPNLARQRRHGHAIAPRVAYRSAELAPSRKLMLCDRRLDRGPRRRQDDGGWRPALCVATNFTPATEGNNR